MMIVTLSVLFGIFISITALVFWAMWRLLKVKNAALSTLALMYQDKVADAAAYKAYIENKHKEETGEVAAAIVKKVRSDEEMH